MKFDIEDLAIEVAATTITLADTLPKKLDFLADQVRRATVSAALNISEANGRIGRSRAYHYRVAYGSTREAMTGFRILERSGTLDAGDLLDQLDRVAAMSWRLMKRR